MRNTLRITKVPSQQFTIFGGQKTEKHAKKYMKKVFSNGAATCNYKLGTFKFHKCGGKINMQGRVTQFLLSLKITG